MDKHNVFLLMVPLLVGTAAVAGGQDRFADPPGMLPGPLKMNQPPKEMPVPTTELELKAWLQALRAEREALVVEQSKTARQAQDELKLEGPETIKLRARLGEMLARFKKNSEPAGPVLQSPTSKDPTEKHQAVKSKSSPDKTPAKAADRDADELGVSSSVVDMAHMLFKNGDYEQALKTYRVVNLTGLKAEERAPLQYLMAVCLRKMGKTNEAIALFRDVGNLREDPQMAGCAQWQIVQLQWLNELAAQLKDLRDRRKALESLP